MQAADLIPAIGSPPIFIVHCSRVEVNNNTYHVKCQQTTVAQITHKYMWYFPNIFEK